MDEAPQLKPSLQEKRGPPRSIGVEAAPEQGASQRPLDTGARGVEASGGPEAGLLPELGEARLKSGAVALPRMVKEPQTELEGESEQGIQGPGRGTGKAQCRRCFWGVTQ